MDEMPGARVGVSNTLNGTHFLSCLFVGIQSMSCSISLVFPQSPIAVWRQPSCSTSLSSYRCTPWTRARLPRKV